MSLRSSQNGSRRDRPPKWEVVRDSVEATFKIFSVRRKRCRHPEREIEDDFYVMESPDWVVIAALTPANELILVEQYRFGADEITLELPAGLVDRGEPPIDAAVRELLEETGYRGRDPQIIGSVRPNPAIQSNKCSIVLIRDAERVADPTPDQHEDIRVEVLDARAFCEHARARASGHAIVHTALFFLEPHLNGKV